MVQLTAKVSAKELANLAVSWIRKAGCEYGDVRFGSLSRYFQVKALLGNQIKSVSIENIHLSLL